MRKSVKILSILLSLLMLTTIVTALPLSANAAVAVKSVKLNRSSLTLMAGKTYTLKATISPSNATKKTITWKSSASSVASVNGSGKVTAKKKGTATITVRTSNGKTAKCKVTVKPVPSGVKLNRTSLSLTAGSKYTLKATVSPSNAGNKSVSWKSSNTSVASVSSSGAVTAKKAGSATITAKTCNGKTAKCKVTVKAAANYSAKIKSLWQYVWNNYTSSGTHIGYKSGVNMFYRRLTASYTSKSKAKVNIKICAYKNGDMEILFSYKYTSIHNCEVSFRWYNNTPGTLYYVNCVLWNTAPRNPVKGSYLNKLLTLNVKNFTGSNFGSYSWTYKPDYISKNELKAAFPETFKTGMYYLNQFVKSKLKCTLKDMGFVNLKMTA